ncbi:response regulator [Devosia psychrophila]|uniref:Response regulator receiver domain-containing protein n=1 Tax=Devosia psychrophila TaxID=728005 RepID=A0A0F5PU84_9HYPH|nr:response regulator [Devosia psychrophila]KKC31379.1 hypothetical protein WH91_19770 [Devosia psychrophila]SFD49213.1 Response regulator receiver domain-containing protein [Devosia psychrophila]
MTCITVLVVEDEPLMRMTIVDALEDANFEVHEAEHATSALATLYGNIEIECLVTDVDLGDGMDGLRLASSVHGKWPTMGIIVVSGKDRVMPADVPDAKFFKKPYKPAEIAGMIRELVVARRKHLVRTAAG